MGAADPLLRREMYISLGCALENLLLAAGANGYDQRLTLMPDASDTNHVARIELSPDEKRPSRLYGAIPDRRTNRYAYDTGRAVPPETLDYLAALGDETDVKVFWFAGPEERKRLGGLTIEATRAFISDGRQSRDSNAWYRHDWDGIQEKRDGITLDASGSSGIIRVAGKVLPEISRAQNDEAWLTATRDTQVPSAAAFGVIAVRDGRNDAQRIKAGRLWQRMHLRATADGLAMTPLNQINERADREAELDIKPTFGDAMRDLIGDTGWQGVFTFRIGYPTTEAPASPRRSVEEVVL